MYFKCNLQKLALWFPSLKQWSVLCCYCVISVWTTPYVIGMWTTPYVISVWTTPYVIGVWTTPYVIGVWTTPYVIGVWTTPYVIGVWTTPYVIGVWTTPYVTGVWTTPYVIGVWTTPYCALWFVVYQFASLYHCMLKDWSLLHIFRGARSVLWDVLLPRNQSRKVCQQKQGQVLLAISFALIPIFIHLYSLSTAPPQKKQTNKNKQNKKTKPTPSAPSFNVYLSVCSLFLLLPPIFPFLSPPSVSHSLSLPFLFLFFFCFLCSFFLLSYLLSIAFVWLID